MSEEKWTSEERADVAERATPAAGEKVNVRGWTMRRKRRAHPYQGSLEADAAYDLGEADAMQGYGQRDLGKSFGSDIQRDCYRDGYREERQRKEREEAGSKAVTQAAYERGQDDGRNGRDADPDTCFPVNRSAYMRGWHEGQAAWTPENSCQRERPESIGQVRDRLDRDLVEVRQKAADTARKLSDRLALIEAQLPAAGEVGALARLLEHDTRLNELQTLTRDLKRMWKAQAELLVMVTSNHNRLDKKVRRLRKEVRG